MSGKGKEKTDGHYRRIYRLFLPVFRIVARFKYGIKGRARRYNEPVLVLSNHTTDMDFLAVACHISNHVYFVCDQHVVGKGLLGRLIKRWFNPVTVYKGALKMAEVKEMRRRVQRGNSLLLFCEGRLSHNGKTMEIDAATAKLARLLGCRVVTFKTVGGFFKQPRWQQYMNRGKLFWSGIVNEYDSDYVKRAPADELLEHIREDLYVDAYEEQAKRMQPFPLKHGARDITRYYDVCPKCRSVDALAVTGDKIQCSCGYSMVYDSCGYLHGAPQLVSTVAEWERLQNGVYSRLFAEKAYFLDEDVDLFEVGDMFQKTGLAHGALESSAHGLMLEGRSFPFREMEKLEILYGGSGLVFSAGGVHYLLHKEGACLNKYLELYLWSRAREEARQPVAAGKT